MPKPSTYGEKHGTYLVKPELDDDGMVRLRIGAQRGRKDHWQEVACVVLAPGEAHDLGWYLRDVLLEVRWRAYEEAKRDERPGS